MKEFQRSILIKRPVQSLAWVGDQLIDWVDGGTRYTLDGTIYLPSVNYAYKFDHAFVSNDGKYVALVELLGTKGLLLKNGEILREFDRSFYYADRYAFPFTFITLPSGEEAMVHCPESYCKLDIEAVKSGRILSKRKSDGMRSCFHSRLAATDDGRYLLSAGWVWHPINRVWLFDVSSVLSNFDQLDSTDLFEDVAQELDEAIFIDNEKVLVSTWTDDDWGEEAETDVAANCLAIYDIPSRKFQSQTPIRERTGRLMPMDNYVVCFNKHPRLIELETGKLIKEWPELATDSCASSIMSEVPPPLALDPVNKRFALASQGELRIVTFECD